MKRLTKYGKGKWTVCYQYADYLAVENRDGIICTIDLDEHGAEPTQEQEANAILIAHAPAMRRELKNVRKLLTKVGASGNMNAIFQQLKAIDKILEETD